MTNMDRLKEALDGKNTGERALIRIDLIGYLANELNAIDPARFEEAIAYALNHYGAKP